MTGEKSTQQKVDNEKTDLLVRDHFNYFHQLRVRYAEIDGQGIVFNAHYLTYFDTAVTEFVRNINYDYLEQVTGKGLDFFLVKATIDFFKPIRFDEIIDIGVTAHKIGKSSLTWLLAIFKKGEEECLASGKLVWVCSRVGTNKSFPLPDDLVKILQ
ncbi:MAG: thioesterase [Firmicutes bacterium ML8_F2]|jgi:acyl-CoA thioester hydrolase|nr:MAG: thioesterase [Firmicutes bacterium ML8_F2]